MKRYLFGFKLTARLRQFIEERRGHNTIITHELVRKDGRRLLRLYSSISPLSLASFYITWPDAKTAWVVYVEEAER